MNLRWMNIRKGRKKNEELPRIIGRIEALKKEEKIPYHLSAYTADMSYSSLMRWKRRLSNGEPLINKPGAKKVEPLNFRKFEEDMTLLLHGKKRTSGTTELYKEHSDSLSRREVNALVAEARQNYRSHKKGEESSVIWHHPGTAWAFDDSEYKDNNGSKIIMDNLQDMASQYKLPPVAGIGIPCGEELAGHLSFLFTRFGAPLFIKRDNGGNLNHQAVNDVLEEYMVIPLNSPVSYPQYNGAVEHTQGEMKEELRRRSDRNFTGRELELCVEIAAHDLNHKPRRKLNGHHSCQVFFGPDRVTFTKKQRKEVFQWIKKLALEIIEQSGNSVLPSAALRVASRMWLQKNSYITVTRSGKVLPH